MTAPAPLQGTAPPHQDVLDELVALGIDLARAVQARSKILAETAEPGEDVTIPFDRIMRGIRRTVALIRHLAQPAQQLNAPTPETLADRAATRRQVIRKVEDIIHREDLEKLDQESLREELHERLDRPELDDDIARRPVEHVVRDICRDLGLDQGTSSRPHKRRTPAEIDILNARAARQPASHPWHLAPPALQHPPPTLDHAEHPEYRNQPRPGADPERLHYLVAAPPSLRDRSSPRPKRPSENVQG